MQSLVVHPAQHQHFAGVVLLRDGRKQTSGVPLSLAAIRGIETAAAAVSWCDSPSWARTAGPSLTG